MSRGQKSVQDQQKTFRVLSPAMLSFVLRATVGSHIIAEDMYLRLYYFKSIAPSIRVSGYWVMTLLLYRIVTVFIGNRKRIA